MELEFLNYKNCTFVQCERAFVFDDFGQTIDDAVVLFIVCILSLESNFDDLKRLHDEHLGPPWINNDAPATMPLKKAKKD